MKLDGIRIQVHRPATTSAVFTRSLDEITARVPEVVAAVRALPVREIVLDGEAMAVDAQGRPRPFQETSSRAATRGARRGARPEAGAGAHAVLLRSAASRRHRPARRARPGALGGAGRRAARRADRRAPVVRPQEQAAEAFAEALAAGQEGVVVKALEAPYDVGRRGSAWVKVKPRHTLDLVVLAVEWGHGRRKGWLSNLHLGARDPRTGGFVMLGKTFKGLTDELLRWQTERFQELAVDRQRLGGDGASRAGGGDRVRRGADQSRAIRAGWRCGSRG